MAWSADEWNATPGFCPFCSDSVGLRACPYSDDNATGCVFWTDQLTDFRSSQGGRTGGCLIFLFIVNQLMPGDVGELGGTG